MQDTLRTQLAKKLYTVTREIVAFLYAYFEVEVSPTYIHYSRLAGCGIDP